MWNQKKHDPNDPLPRNRKRNHFTVTVTVNNNQVNTVDNNQVNTVDNNQVNTVDMLTCTTIKYSYTGTILSEIMKCIWTSFHFLKSLPSFK